MICECILGMDFLNHTDAQIKLWNDSVKFTALNEIKEIEIQWQAKYER